MDSRGLLWADGSGKILYPKGHEFHLKAVLRERSLTKYYLVGKIHS